MTNHIHPYPFQRKMKAIFWGQKDIDMIYDTDPEELQERWTGIIRDNISYDELIRTHKWDKERIDESNNVIMT